MSLQPNDDPDMREAFADLKRADLNRVSPFAAMVRIAATQPAGPALFASFHVRLIASAALLLLVAVFAGIYRLQSPVCRPISESSISELPGLFTAAPESFSPFPITLDPYASDALLPLHLRVKLF
jgi:hypothetical protein